MADRKIRWVEAFRNGTQPIFWNQVKGGKVGRRTVPVTSDRNSKFEQTVPNPDYVPPDQRVAGTTYTAKQRRETITQRPVSDAQHDAMQAEADKVFALIANIADGEVTSFLFSGEANELRYSQKADVGGTEVHETVNTDDETLLEAGRAFADFVAETVQTSDKPLEVADGPVTLNT